MQNEESRLTILYKSLGENIKVMENSKNREEFEKAGRENLEIMEEILKAYTPPKLF